VDIAPIGGSIVIAVKANQQIIATVAIADGALESGATSATVPLLLENSKLNIDVVSIPVEGRTFPGKNLSVQIRT